MRNICTIEGCGEFVAARGWCKSHYYKWYRRGDPLGSRRAPPGEPLGWIQRHVQHTGQDCLTWPYRLGGRGYAYFNNQPATRVMCEMAHGPAPSPGHHVAHSCGKGHLACINPRHLRWATRQENEDDKLSHGTRLMGEQLSWSKLTEDAVREIRKLHGTASYLEIADRYGVSRSAIGHVITNKTWRHVQ